MTHSIFRRAAIGVLALSMAMSGGLDGLADETATDANIVTGLDISESIEPAQMYLEIKGMAQAVRSPEVLQAIHGGTSGRIGFAVFAWHHNQFPVLVSWTVIASDEDALDVSRQIEARLAVDVENEARLATKFYMGRLTDISQAVDHAAQMLSSAPYPTGRNIINIIGNGPDNFGVSPASARDRFVNAGGVINGVVIGGNAAVMDYYRDQLIGGPGAFVMAADDPGTLSQAMVRKFVHEIALAAPLPENNYATERW